MSDKETSHLVTEKEWKGFIQERDSRMLPVPDYVERYEGMDIVAWEDVPEQYQKKILAGTMTNEDWAADWADESSPVAEIFDNVHYLNAPVQVGKVVEDVISDMLNESESPVARHTHVWRKEYPYCMIKTCGQMRTKYGNY